MPSADTTLFVLGLAGVAVFAVSGVLAVGDKQLDLFGVLVLGVVTAVGGGTIRDVILGLDVFWVTEPVFIMAAAVAALLTMAAERLVSLPRRLILFADAAGLALFSVLGAERSLDAGSGYLVAAVMGLLTGAAGGMMRDVLAGEIPLVLRRELYATAGVAAALGYLLMRAAGSDSVPAMVAGVVVGLALRLAALRWKLGLPVYRARG
jgi:uncharacterized membrane protein YeiH